MKGIQCSLRKTCVNYHPDNCMYCTYNYNAPKIIDRFKEETKLEIEQNISSK